MLSYTKAGTTRNSVIAHLSGSSTCTGAGITANSPTPVLALCRQLLAAGLDPDQAMDVYRGATLALRVRSLREAARLEINSHGTGFAARAIGGPAPPMRQTEVADAEAPAP
jgi:hypothetical protein